MWVGCNYLGSGLSLLVWTCRMSSTRGLAMPLHPSNLFELWSLLLSIHLILAAVTKLIIHHSSCCFLPKLWFLYIKTTGPCPPLQKLSSGIPACANCGKSDAVSALRSPPSQSYVSGEPGSGDGHQICPEIQWRRLWLDTLMSSLTTCSCTATSHKWTNILFRFQKHL